MALPINTTPTYTVTIPSTGQEISYRPFLVKDQKNLLVAQQSENQKVMADTLKSVIQSCIVGDIDVSKLATFDIEYLFLHIRGKSVGEEVPLLLKCDEDHGEDNKKAQIKYTVRVDDIQVHKDPNHTNRFDLFNDVGVQMKYPSFEMIDKFQNAKTDDASVMFNVIADCIDFIYDSNEVYYAHDQSPQEIAQFLENLTTEQFDKIQSFFETMPKLTHDVEYNCPVCGKHHKVRIEGLQSFF
jgi:hypothetical protein